MPANTFHNPRPRSTAARAAAIVTGGVIGFVSLGFLATGGAALWGDSQKDADGYLTTRSEHFSTTTHAIATDNLDIDLDGAGWVLDNDSYGKVRLKVDSSSDKPVFAGIAPTRDVEDYLHGIAHTRLTDVDYSPFEADYDDRPGSGRPAPPADQSFWAASVDGTGPQTLTWDAQEGDWSVVLMNADGTAGVDRAVSAGAKLGFLDVIGWVGLGGGLALLITAGGLVFLGVRMPRSARVGPSPLGPPQPAA